MGVWGPGNFDSDGAGDFLDSVILQLQKNVKECLAPEKHEDFDLDFDGDSKLMPSVDILITLCEHYKASPQLDKEVVQSWRQAYLQIFDQDFEYYSPKTEYKAKRRKVIEDTFLRLQALVEKYPH